MYAALVKLTIEQARAPAVAASLKSEILPRVKSAEGFVGGYWLDPLTALALASSSSRQRTKRVVRTASIQLVSARRDDPRGRRPTCGGGDPVMVTSKISDNPLANRGG